MLRNRWWLLNAWVRLSFRFVLFLGHRAMSDDCTSPWVQKTTHDTLVISSPTVDRFSKLRNAPICPRRGQFCLRTIGTCSSPPHVSSGISIEYRRRLNAPQYSSTCFMTHKAVREDERMQIRAQFAGRDPVCVWRREWWRPGGAAVTVHRVGLASTPSGSGHPLRHCTRIRQRRCLISSD